MDCFQSISNGHSWYELSHCSACLLHIPWLTNRYQISNITVSFLAESVSFQNHNALFGFDPYHIEARTIDRHFTDDESKNILISEKVSIKISLKCDPKGPNDNKSISSILR